MPNVHDLLLASLTFPGFALLQFNFGKYRVADFLKCLGNQGRADGTCRIAAAKSDHTPLPVAGLNSSRGSDRCFARKVPSFLDMNTAADLPVTDDGDDLITFQTLAGYFFSHYLYRHLQDHIVELSGIASLALMPESVHYHRIIIWTAGISCFGITTGVVSALLWKPLQSIQDGNAPRKQHSSDFIGHEFVLQQDVTVTHPGQHRYSGVDWKVEIDASAGDRLNAGQKVAVTSVDAGILRVKAVLPASSHGDNV